MLLKSNRLENVHSPSLTQTVRKYVEPRARPLPQLDVDRAARLEGGGEEGEPALAVALAAVGERRQRQQRRAHEHQLQGARQCQQVGRLQDQRSALPSLSILNHSMCHIFLFNYYLDFPILIGFPVSLV